MGNIKVYFIETSSNYHLCENFNQQIVFSLLIIIKCFLLKLFIDGSQTPSNTENGRSELSNKFLKRLNLIDKQGTIKKPTRKLVLKKVKNALPILGWAVPYDWRENLAGDVIAGVTLAVMQVLSGIEAVFKYHKLIYHILI